MSGDERNRREGCSNRPLAVPTVPVIPTGMWHCGPIYQGVRRAGGCYLFRDGHLLLPVRSQIVRNHSPDGFEWGYGGSGPAQLALALLLDLYNDVAVAERHYQRFKQEVIARLSSDVWQLVGAELRARVDPWIAAELPPSPATDLDAGDDGP